MCSNQEPITVVAVEGARLLVKSLPSRIITRESTQKKKISLKKEYRKIITRKKSSPLIILSKNLKRGRRKERGGEGGRGLNEDSTRALHLGLGFNIGVRFSVRTGMMGGGVYYYYQNPPEFKNHTSAMYVVSAFLRKSDSGGGSLRSGHYSCESMLR